MRGGQSGAELTLEMWLGEGGGEGRGGDGGAGSPGQPGSTPTSGVRALPPSKAEGLGTGRAGVHVLKTTEHARSLNHTEERGCACSGG